MTSQKYVLAIDPGTKTGWAIGRSGHPPIASGTWDLAPARLRRYEGGGARYMRLQAFLDDIANLYEAQIGHVIYEEVRSHAGVDAAHVYGGCMAIITKWCEDNSIPYTVVNVSTLKKHATGKGNASKDMMIAYAKKWKSTLSDDNEADALHMLDYAIRTAIII